MNILTGIDAVEISRFSKWQNYSRKSLNRIFSDNEIDYCLSNPNKSSERFAARFAAKEALYKALSHLFATHLPLLTFCKHVELEKNNNMPNFKIDWAKFNLKQEVKSITVSITHSNMTAIAVVIVCS